MQKTIGCIILPLQDDTVFYPLIWLILKTTIETKSQFDYNFLDPIILNETINDDYLKATDILFASLYTWNRSNTEKILERYKQLNPNGKIVVGGPHTLENDYNLYDYVVFGEAETCANLIVDKINGSNITSIPNTKSKYLTQFYEEKVLDFSVSPYLNQKESLIRLKNSSPVNLKIIFETNRGCPYGCTFCDWGQATMSKIRIRPIDIIKKELELFSELEVTGMFLADANFGILKRDIEIAEYIADLKVKTGYIKSLYYSAAKNNAENNLRISEIFYNSGLIQNYVFSLQHTDSSVLKEIKRINLPIKKLEQTADFLLKKNIPTAVQMILGNPGDTVVKWKKSLIQLLEMNMHDQIQILYFALLPGAPASKSEYIETHRIQTSVIKLFPNVTNSRNSENLETIITSTKTFSQKDWIEMNIFARFIQATHEIGLTKVLSIYLHNTGAKSYENFYSDLYDIIKEEFVDVFKNIENSLHLWINSPGGSLELQSDTGEDFIDIEYLLCLYFLKHKDRFYYLVKKSLTSVLNSTIQDLINWQKNSIIDCNYDPEKGVLITCKYDWYEWWNNKKFDENVLPAKNFYRYIDKKIRSENGFQSQDITFSQDSNKEKQFQKQIVVGLYNRKNRLFLKDREFI